MEFRLRRRAFEDIGRSRGALAALDKVAEEIRDRARRSATSVSADLTDAIVAEPAAVINGEATAKIGYEKTRPGFVLFFHEVGTENHPPTPHLRSALRGRSTS